MPGTDPDLFDLEHAALAEASVVYDDVHAPAGIQRLALGELIGHYERLLRETRRLIQRSDRQEREMNVLNQRLQTLAINLDYRARHDTLTGVLNRGAVIELCNDTLLHSDIALVVLDLDHFKRINDTFGHPAGDAVLCAVVEQLQSVVGEIGQIGRVGGEEFTVMLPGLLLDDAMQLAEYMRAAVATHVFPSPIERAMTASFGVSWSAAGTPFESAYSRADEALYVAKRNGRNQVVRAR
ncbi:MULTISPECIES: diguanylate cyclase [Silvimonas]|uniref:diguanylate cyclase n=1 Tax=Silvimonas TaxID=300264 RepID=UPI0024B35CB1|nr:MULTISPECIES: diguanylate cyclase [Silvimonas]MDR3430181.1 diguanylate cyclase [Silvimonas sp.]